MCPSQPLFTAFQPAALPLPWRFLFGWGGGLLSGPFTDARIPNSTFGFRALSQHAQRAERRLQHFQAHPHLTVRLAAARFSFTPPPSKCALASSHTHTPAFSGVQHACHLFNHTFAKNATPHTRAPQPPLTTIIFNNTIHPKKLNRFCFLRARCALRFSVITSGQA